MKTRGTEKKWRVFSLVGVSIFMTTLDSSIVNVALPYMADSLSSDIGALQWVVMAYLLTVSCLLLTFGRLSDIRGRRPVYVMGFLLFAAGSVFSGSAVSAAYLVTGRIIQGVGAAMLMACSPALVVDAFQPEERGRALGLMGAVVACGLTMGPLAGGLILAHFSWRVIFWLNVPIGLMSVLAGLIILRDHPGGSSAREPLDKWGSLLMAILICSLILGVSRAPVWGVWSVRILACLMVSGVSALVFWQVEKRCPFPLMDIQLMQDPLFVRPLMAAAVLFACLFVLIFMIPFYLAYPCNLPAHRTGMVMILPFACLLVISPLAGAAADRVGSRLPCTAGMALLGTALGLLAGLTPGQGPDPVLWPLALAGVGTALFVSPNNTAIMGGVPLHRRGIASGALATARNLGMVLGVALAGALFSSALPPGSLSMGSYTPDMDVLFMEGFRRVMLAGACLSVPGVWLCWFRKNKAPS